MKTVITLLLTVLAAPALAQSGAKELRPAPTVAFKGVPVGTSGADLIEAYPWIDCPGGGDHQVCTLSPKNCYSSIFEKCMRSMTYGGVPLKSVDFHLFNGRVALIFVKVETRDFDRLKEAMSLAFGKPSKVGTTLARTAAGVEIPNDYYHWLRGGGQISASRFGDDIGHSSVSIMTPPGVKEAERRRLLEIEAGAKDL